MPPFDSQANRNKMDTDALLDKVCMIIYR